MTTDKARKGSDSGPPTPHENRFPNLFDTLRVPLTLFNVKTAARDVMNVHRPLFHEHFNDTQIVEAGANPPTILIGYSVQCVKGRVGLPPPHAHKYLTYQISGAVRSDSSVACIVRLGKCADVYKQKRLLLVLAAVSIAQRLMMATGLSGLVDCSGH
jgi:hypothetical protein